MLVPLLLAALLAQTQAVPAPPPAASALHFLVPVPSRSGRQIRPLTATLKLDSEAEEAREEEDLVGAINGERTTRGLGPLRPDPVLSEAARAHSREMCALNYFNHCSPVPQELTPMDRYLDQLAAAGDTCPPHVLVGENIFYASETSGLCNAEYAHRSLMASPGHRRNILEPRFSKVGVGLYRDPRGRFWITEMFLRDS